MPYPQAAKPFDLTKELMKIDPNKMKNISTRLSRLSIKLQPAKEERIGGFGEKFKKSDTPVIQIVTTDPIMASHIGMNEFSKTGKIVLGTIERLPGGKYWINDSFGYSNLKNYLSADLSADMAKFNQLGRRSVSLEADSLEELLDILAKNIM